MLAPYLKGPRSRKVKEIQKLRKLQSKSPNFYTALSTEYFKGAIDSILT